MMNGGGPVRVAALQMTGSPGLASPDQRSILCRHCGVAGVDLQVQSCGCHLHARCCGLPAKVCPGCQKPIKALYLLPMCFEEMDKARQMAMAASATMRSGSGSQGSRREKKRKSATIARLGGVSRTFGESDRQEALVSSNGEASDLRTGRWTSAEIAYCDLLIERFCSGELPVADGTKLNDFLSLMLKSKQSRLTKKMKNAKLSTKSFNRKSGCISNPQDASKFSQAENDFFQSIPCDMERAEIRFHLQKEWRELFSALCMSVLQSLNADDWLSSVEEIERRTSHAKDAARMARRKQMMGYALSEDSANLNPGVFISQTPTTSDTLDDDDGRPTKISRTSPKNGSSAGAFARRGSRIVTPPFLTRVVNYMERHRIPFEHIDSWVPSFVSNGGSAPAPDNKQGQRCRLCYAGSASTHVQIIDHGACQDISSEDFADLRSFGDYSQKFSFEVGCGLPGRVYQSGIPSWEQNVQNAPPTHFERCGGAKTWGIKTVLGVPVPSPNVGRIVVLLYSKHDRPRDQDMVARLVNEMTRLMPSPKWKLVVDVAPGPPTPALTAASATNQTATPATPSIQNHSSEILAMIQENTPKSGDTSGYTSLQLLLLKQSRNTKEKEVVKMLFDRFNLYRAEARPRSDIALMLVRDFMLMNGSFNLVGASPASTTMPVNSGNLSVQQNSAIQGLMHAAGTNQPTAMMTAPTAPTTTNGASRTSGMSFQQIAPAPTGMTRAEMVAHQSSGAIPTQTNALQQTSHQLQLTPQTSTWSPLTISQSGSSVGVYAPSSAYTYAPVPSYHNASMAQTNQAPSNQTITGTQQPAQNISTSTPTHHQQTQQTVFALPPSAYQPSDTH